MPPLSLLRYRNIDIQKGQFLSLKPLFISVFLFRIPSFNITYAPAGNRYWHGTTPPIGKEIVSSVTFFLIHSKCKWNGSIANNWPLAFGSALPFHAELLDAHLCFFQWWWILYPIFSTVLQKFLKKCLNQQNFVFTFFIIICSRHTWYTYLLVYL